MMEHYLKGRVHHDMGEAPIALKCHQKATEMADTTQKDCDLRTLVSVYGQMADLFDRNYLPVDEMKALRKAEHFAWKNKDTFTAIIGFRLITRVYHLRCVMEACYMSRTNALRHIANSNTMTLPPNC